MSERSRTAQESRDIVVCSDCGLPHRWRGIAPGRVARCSRCDAVIGRGHRLSLEAVLALTITAAVAFTIGVTSNVLVLHVGSAETGATLLDSIRTIWSDGQALIAIVAAITTLVAPAFFIGLRLLVLGPLALGRRPPWFAFSVRVLHQADRWNMVQVFAIGTLLSLVKITALADAVPGLGLYSLGVVLVLFSAIESAGLQHLWWRLP